MIATFRRGGAVVMLIGALLAGTMTAGGAVYGPPAPTATDITSWFQQLSIDTAPTWTPVVSIAAPTAVVVFSVPDMSPSTTTVTSTIVFLGGNAPGATINLVFGRRSLTKGHVYKVKATVTAKHKLRLRFPAKLKRKGWYRVKVVIRTKHRKHHHTTYSVRRGAFYIQRT
ncbi:MAG: hypothetical protein QM572_07040 [Nocardioides sp.]|uniref:hypothetical protein n=1 Tax=Nocardioides sp. TaxID=35761 RepID=UPI0039E3808D